MKQRSFLLLAVGILSFLFLFWFVIGHGPTADSVRNGGRSAKEQDVKMVEWEDDNGNPMMIPESELPEEIKEERRRRKEISEKFAAQWSTPITFYGRVVDEKGNGVEGAEVKIIISDTSQEGTTHYQLKSDSMGLFALGDVRGKGLSVYVEHPGYLTSKQSRRNFEYAGGTSPFVPNLQSPEIFRLQRKGEAVPLVELKDIRIKMLPDGKPITMDLYTGKIGTPPMSESLQIRAWIDVDKSDPHRPFPWKLEITSPGGSILATDEEFVLTAPDTGFQESVIMDMSRPQSPDWQRQKSTKLILRTSEGNYALLKMTIIPSLSYVRVTGCLNPDGGRSLHMERGYKITAQRRQDGSISLIYPKGYEPKTP
jgi:hypothetical protein